MTKQINNLKIVHSKLYDKWQVKSPDGRVLEEFEKLDKAESCARGITDFVKHKKAFA